MMIAEIIAAGGVLQLRELVKITGHDERKVRQSPALSVLREIMMDKGEQAQVRITAARSVLEYSLKLAEQADILEQLRELEKWREETDARR